MHMGRERVSALTYCLFVETRFGLPVDGGEVERDAGQSDKQAQSRLVRRRVNRKEDEEKTDHEEEDGQDSGHADGAVHVRSHESQPEQGRHAQRHEQRLTERRVVDEIIDVGDKGIVQRDERLAGGRRSVNVKRKREETHDQDERRHGAEVVDVDHGEEGGHVA